MDEPARKRRRTNSPFERASSPLRRPPRRPSFASPTKASLARNYPSLLPTRPSPSNSPSRPSSTRDAPSRGKQAREFILAGGNTDVQEALERASGTGTRHATPPAQRDPGQSGPSTSQDAAEDDPELPATPSQQGLDAQDGPRRGILFSSPSKRPPRIKNPVKQSPLRPRAAALQPVSTTEPVGGVPDEEDVAELPKNEVPDPEFEKRKQEKARLQSELAVLEAQTRRCTDEIAREAKRDPLAVLRSSERADLNDFLTSISGLETQEQKPAPLSSLLCSFLPFSAISAPRLPVQDRERPIASHWPVELADPLPYLEMFSSLKFSTKLSLPDTSRPSVRVLQTHIIDISGPQKILTAQISITINTSTHEITSMSILNLSGWAASDLGKYLQTKAKENDLSNACWAIESYWALASKRAQYWHRCETTFAHLVRGSASEDTENAHVRPQKASGKLSRRDLTRHLGRETWVLQDKHVLLKVNWRIDFDWVGEASSYVTVEPAFPSVWTEGDVKKTFNKVPRTFQALVKTKGVFEATRVMAALLFA